MIDARIATNLLVFLRPQIDQATWLLEAVKELQAIAAPVPMTEPSVAVDAQGKTAEQFLAESQPAA